MRKLIMPLLLIILLIANYHNIFATLSPNDDGFMDEEIYNRLEEILDQRIQIFNSLHNEGKMNLKDIKRKLRQYIIDPLLASDLEAFESMILEGIDYEVIENFQLVSFKILKQQAESIQLEVEVNWLLKGMTDVRNEKIVYFMEMEKQGERWYLRDYYPK